MSSANRSSLKCNRKSGRELTKRLIIRVLRWSLRGTPEGLIEISDGTPLMEKNFLLKFK